MRASGGSNDLSIVSGFARGDTGAAEGLPRTVEAILTKTSAPSTSQAQPADNDLHTQISRAICRPLVCSRP